VVGEIAQADRVQSPLGIFPGAVAAERVTEHGHRPEGAVLARCEVAEQFTVLGSMVLGPVCWDRAAHGRPEHSGGRGNMEAMSLSVPYVPAAAALAAPERCMPVGEHLMRCDELDVPDAARTVPISGTWPRPAAACRTIASTIVVRVKSRDVATGDQCREHESLHHCGRDAQTDQGQQSAQAGNGNRHQGKERRQNQQGRPRSRS